VSAIELRDVFRVHSTPEGDAAALQGLTLSVGRGEILGVLGPSGAGKTSLLRILGGLDRPSAGSVRVFELDLARAGGRALAAYRTGTIGYIEQRFADSLDPDLPIGDSVSLRLRFDGASDARTRSHDLLGRVGLADRLTARPGELSGGEQQRVAVAAALAHRPRLLLADEPTGELDRENAEAVFALIAELARAEETTAIVVSHDPRAADFVDRAVRIRDGRVSDERTGRGDEQIVVGRGGWIRLSEELLRAAGVVDRATARVRDGEIVIAGPRAVAVAEEPVTESAAAVDRGAALRTRGLTKRYGSRVVLDALDATFDSGALTVVTGPSGSGKTTLLDVVAGLELPDGGSVLIGDVEVTALDRAGRAALRRERIGYVAQQPELIPFLSARENVALGLDLRGRPADAAVGALAAVGLAELADQRVERLSGGERFRVAIARALAPAPDVLIADEPTSRLDEPNARGVVSLLARLARERAAAVVVASHDPIAIEQADELVALG
jgi:ABC-type lipoprotein export system ATPase subunit